MALAALVAGCGAGTLTPDGGVGTGQGGQGGRAGQAGPGGQGGSTGSAGSTGTFDPANLLSDFGEVGRAMILPTGTPPRNGYWYAYNDRDAGSNCVQSPPADEAYPHAGPPHPSPLSGGSALYAHWSSCDVWGAGIAADFNVPFSSALFYYGPKVAYDASAYGGVMFLALAPQKAAGDPSGQVSLRLMLPMRATTSSAGGGLCPESATFVCGDHFGMDFSLPTDGNWHRISVRFTDVAFKQAGWGATFPWNPADVTGIQIQGRAGEFANFYIDDVYLVP